MNLTIENGKFMLRFPYDAALVTQIRLMNCGIFNKVYKAWEFPLTAVAYKKLKALGLSHPEVEEWLKKRKKVIHIYKHTFKTECLPHQIEALEFTLTMFGMKVK
jgi:hypothetical protein